ncbi:Gp37-like protein, partial [Rhodococcoides fascians]|uniref:Gp37-like protein n=1 Tax=Rhodococcoides fascians TaxID=1828 RepID=UPI00050CCEB5
MPPLLDFADVRQLHMQKSIEQAARARARPLVQIWDKNWGDDIGSKPIAIIFGEIDGDFEEKLNDTGEGLLNLFGRHPICDWLITELEEEEDVHITVDSAGLRWHGKALTITEEQDETGIDFVRLKFLHGYEHAKKIVCFSNPFLPAIFQFPKLWTYAGSAANGIRLLMFCNLWRRYAPGWQLPDQIFDPASWLANLNPANWPQVVLPPKGQDTSMWAVISTRFGNLHDVITPVLRDSGLQLVCTRWLPGDPQPAPTHFTLTRPTLVWDVVDQSGVRGPSGTILDGLLNLGATLTSGNTEEIVTASPWGDPPPQYSSPTFFGTVKEFPWVVYRNAMRYEKQRGTGLSGVKTWRMVIHKALAGAVVTGGKSPAWAGALASDREGT